MIEAGLRRQHPMVGDDERPAAPRAAAEPPPEGEEPAAIEAGGHRLLHGSARNPT